jgi:hypothetical protein
MALITKGENMKKVYVCVFLLCLFQMGVYGQDFGGIKGTVKDTEKAPLPGVVVTLTGSKIAPKSATTSEMGNFRFMSLPVAKDYVLTLKLPGFKTLIRESLDIVFGKDIVLDLVLEPATIAEEVTVLAETPVIDPKRTQVGITVTNEMIMSLPTARNPWTTLSLAPGMLMSVEDVGGNEGGQQSAFYGHGSNFEDNSWNIDGANVTDWQAPPAYENAASYEEMQINYGNNDIKAQTGGVQINFITKRGGNNFSGMFYMDASEKAWQAENITPALKVAGYKSPGINKVYLYGASFGGPIIKEKAWFFGTYGIQDIDAFTLQSTVSDKTLLVSGYSKLDLQLTAHTKFGAYLEYNNKRKWNRGDPAFNAPESLYNQVGPGYIWKGEVEQTAGNLFLNLKTVYVDTGWTVAPVGGSRTADGSGNYTIVSYYPKYYVSGNIDEEPHTHKQLDFTFNGNYFAENVLGGDHEIKFGVDYVHATWNTSVFYEANIVLADYGPADFLPTGEFWSAWLERDYKSNLAFDKYSAFFQDTATFGRFTFNIGLRYDREHSMVKDVNIPASPWLPYFMPAVNVDKIDPGVSWRMFSPRLSITYDLFGNGNDILKFSVARYGSTSYADFANFINPLGWTEIDVIWQDLNHNGRVAADELFGLDQNTGMLMDPSDPSGWLYYSSSVNPADPKSITPRNRIDPNYRSPLLDEVSASYEKELFADFAARLEFFYKKNHRGIWDKRMLADGTVETAANYQLIGTNTIVNQNYYDLDQYYPYYYRTNYSRSYQSYVAAELVLNKRLSHKWMMDASFTYSKWTQHWNGEYLDPNNMSYLDGQQLAPGFSRANWGWGGSGINARWMFKFSGLYQLPWGINLSGILTAREGYILADYVFAYRPNLGYKIALYGNPDGSRSKFGDRRLPDLWMLNLRLEKVFALSETSSVALAVDAFNATNSAVSLNRQTQIDAPEFGQDIRILNPRVLRFGVRFTF